MNLTQTIQRLKNDDAFMQNVTSWKVLPERRAQYADIPDYIDPKIKNVLAKRGITRLYSHQRQALDATYSGKDIVVVTPTASGKTMCYNLPVLTEILSHPESRALYLFPTKALSQDQVSELYAMIGELGADIKTFTYDGDTPAAARTAIRQAGHVVVTNPDMLHAGILPHHTKWVKLFENLKYIVIDEIHAYRGVFGSNLCNVLRRLLRICAFYGSHPQFICCSATIANPKEFAEAMLERQVVCIDQNGAPAGERNVVFYNPPVVNAQLGIRESAQIEALSIVSDLVKNDIQTIVFARSRLVVEVLVNHLKRLVADPIGEAGRVRGYRGGYLPGERRDIEKRLRNGEITCVVSTNALELGIDIGQLDVCVLVGYPGSIASTWQQAGRAGRRGSESLLIVVGSSAPMDQYVMTHPEYFFGKSPEKALINADNIYILLNHMKCAAYELPFTEGERFGKCEGTAEMLEYLAEEGILRKVGARYHWMAEEFPQAGISLRSASDQNFVIIDITQPKTHRVIGEMDRFTVPMLLHQYAIYMHEGKQYQVEELDFDDKKAYVRKVDVDYYTDANLVTSLKVLSDDDEKPAGELVKHRGDVLVSSMVTLFKKMKLDTGENLGWGPVTLPELEMQTTACWWTMPDSIEAKYGKDIAQSAMLGLSNLLRSIVPAHLLCAGSDVHVSYRVKDTHTGKSTLYVYDAIPGGLGLSDKVYEMDRELFEQALDMARRCPCRAGCPSCVGAGAGEGVKKALIEILEQFCEK